MSIPDSPQTSDQESPAEPAGRYLTVPNGLCLLRLVGSMGMIGFVLADQSGWFLVGYLFLTATDWLDGKLAIWLDQRTTFGARIDSIADAAMYSVLLFAGVWWHQMLLMEQGLLIGVALASYVLACAAALRKYGQLPSYHTRSAKVSWLLMLVAVISLFWKEWIWPLTIAMLGVTWTNLESLLITRLLPEWRANVISYWHARKLENRTKKDSSIESN